MTAKISVVLIGAGAMGGALLQGWLKAGLLDPQRSAVIDPAPSSEIITACEQVGLALNPAIDWTPDFCVLAVKPQSFAMVLPNLYWPEIGNTVFISVAAGKSIQSIRNELKVTIPDGAKIIRIMPNLPVKVGKGVCLAYADDTIALNAKEQVNRLLLASGAAFWMATEEDIDKGMSLSGCGPAYLFLLTEAMQLAGMAQGLEPEIATQLVRNTIIGAASLMEHEAQTAEELRQAVTSPGGTTAAALEILDSEHGLRELMTKAVKAATLRARELST
ncbi:MAG: pyrroline-5-carboxylate reductase [bacterium]